MALTKFNFNSFDLTTAASKGLAFNSNANGFETSSSTSMVLIKTLTASSSANLSFVHGSSDVVLDSTYPIYVFKFINIHPATNNTEFQFNMSTDSGSNYNVTKTTTTFNAHHNESDSATNLLYDTNADIAQGTGFQLLAGACGNDNDQCINGTLHLFLPSSTTFVKHFISRVAGFHEADYAFDFFTAGYGNTTSAIDAVQFKFDSGNIDSGVIKLYGVS